VKERDAWIALHQVKGAGWHTIDRLYRAGWVPPHPMSPAVMEAARAMGVTQQRLDRIREKCTPAFVREVKVELQRREICAVTVWDDDYPSLLREIPQPPWVLYVKGDVSLLDGPGIAVVGTRKPTPYGRQAARMLSEQLAGAGWVVVSGMATGIDSEAHRGALRKNGATVAVLGTGVDVVYPRNNRSLYHELIRHGAVCSEMPPGTEPHPGLFPQRNRIISGLSYGTVVVEAAERSGSLITADCSMEQGREVFAVPGPITSTQSAGTHRLIQEGAKCVRRVEDIWEEFAHLMPSPSHESSGEANLPLTVEEERVFSLIGIDPVSLETVMNRCPLPAEAVHSVLLSLQLKQRIRQLPGMQFVRM
jgi:DNA processing protein